MNKPTAPINNVSTVETLHATSEHKTIDQNETLHATSEHKTINQNETLHATSEHKTIDQNEVLHATSEHKTIGQNETLHATSLQTPILKPYNKYKPSGIAWLGDIPEHWEVKRMKNIGKALIGITYNPKDLTDAENGILVLRSSNVQNGKIDYKDCSYVNQEIPNSQITRKGDILICSRNGSIGLIGKNATIDDKSEGKTFGAFMTIFRSDNNQYISYFLKSSQFKSQIGLCFTSTINQLTNGILNNLFLAIPKEIEEQTAIANFLDYKTSKIDRFIRKKKQLIKLLKEQKAGIINDAVTGKMSGQLLGISDKLTTKNSPLTTKPSGIEWLGDIPEHWEVRKLKYVVSLNDETLNEKTNPDYELRYIDIGNVDESGKVAEIVNYKFKDAPSRAKRIVKEGDVIISTVRTYLKAITQISSDCENLIVSTGFAVLRPKMQIESNFLNFSVRANYFIQKVCAESFGVSYPAINASDLVNFEIAYPNLTEQTAIVSHIEKESAIINKTIATIEKEIKLVQEYRTAIIAEAVTGKIDVREYVETLHAMSLPENNDEELEEELSIAAEDEAEYNNQEME